MSTLEQWISDKGCAGEFEDVIEKHGHLEIVAEFGYEKQELPFPQPSRTHRNVHNWALLSDGSAIGWNESPRTGWSFPRVGKSTVEKVYPDLQDEISAGPPTP